MVTAIAAAAALLKVAVTVVLPPSSEMVSLLTLSVIAGLLVVKLTSFISVVSEQPDAV